MEAKILIVLLIAINCYSSCGAALRRTPKVYNALITTDDNLTSSRAFPVIQPTIHESGVAHYPFDPYNPYGFYSPPLVRFGQPLVPGLAPNQPFPYPLPQQQRFPPQFYRQPPPNSGPQLLPAPGAAAQQPPPQDGSPVESNAPTAAPPTEDQQPVQPPTLPSPPKNPAYMTPLGQNPPKQMPEEKLPIPLNEFGLPPSLIPLQQYANRRPNGPVPPYAFNQYPLIYDPITGYREQYLPPYEYFPSQHQHQHFAIGGGPPGAPKPLLPTPPAATPPPPPPPPPPPSKQQPSQEPAEEAAASEPQPQPENPPQLPTAVDFESIKNASKNKNSAVPDVPPPPIPSGAKPQES